MKIVKQTVTYQCDRCSVLLDVAHPSFDKEGATHYCKGCCRELEEYVHRVLYKEVRDRRGGWRQLGTYDG